LSRPESNPRTLESATATAAATATPAFLLLDFLPLKQTSQLYSIMSSSWLKDLYGGLRPILSLLVLDTVIFLGLCYSTFSPSSVAANQEENQYSTNLIVLLVSSVCALASLGLTKQWTLLFPFLPFLALQLFQHVTQVGSSSSSSSSGNWGAMLIVVLSSILLLIGAALVIVFPTVELPPVKGPYNVGIVDLFLPVDMASGGDFTNQKNGGATAAAAATATATECDPWSGDSITHVPVRILYPTLDKPGKVRHLKPSVAIEFCKQTMKFGAPPSIQDFAWIMHTWSVSGLRAKQNATLLPSDKAEKLPIVIYSHGLGGTSDVYSYQTMALASQGYIVLSLNHQDGSAPVVQRVDGSLLTFDFEIPGLKGGKDTEEEYYRSRRSRTNLRVKELLASTEKFLGLDEMDLPELKESNLSLVGRLQKDHVFFMGHSFGGATVLTAAKRRPDMIKAVIAHDPATEWMPDDARKSLFADDRLEGLSRKFTGGTGGYGSSSMDNVKDTAALHDVNMLLLFSNEWRNTGFCDCDLVEEMFAAGRLGPKDGSSSYSIISKAHHQEFSDTNMLMPTWLSRSSGAQGTRSPIDTAEEIADKTRIFLETVRRE
jgi:dienelactone hydrolase